MRRITGVPRVGCVLTLTAIFSWISPTWAQDHQTEWRSLPAFTTYTSPALSAHPDPADGRLYAAAVAFSGLVAVTSTETPDGWGAWELLGPDPCPPQCPDEAFYANTDTQPIFASEDDTLYLFARGADNNLYMIRKVGTGAWEPEWTRLTSDGRIGARFSVALTRQLAATSPELHVLSPLGEGFRMEVRHMDLSGAEIAPRKMWVDVIDGVMGSDGEGQLLTVIRTLTHNLVFETKLWPWTSPWQEEDRLLPQGPLGEFYDLSNVVFYAGAFHVMHAMYYQCNDITGEHCYGLGHTAHVRGRPGHGPSSIPVGYVPDGPHPARSTLAVYRNKLLAAYSDLEGVHYLRWDTADPYFPWVGGELVHASHNAQDRPALAVLNRRDYLAFPEYADPNFGHDLFAAIRRVPGDSVSYINLSRAAYLLESMEQFTFWDSNEVNPPDVCQKLPSDATLIGNPEDDGRPIYSELGFNIWMLPGWLSSHVYKDFAGNYCQQGGGTSGRFPPPCNETRYPVIIRPAGAIFICDGIWVHRANDYYEVWEELGHTTAGIFGFDNNDANPPQQWNADLSGIDLDPLIEGFNIFGESHGSDCPLGVDPDPPNAGRCRGFTGLGNNYDVNDRQHSYIYPTYYYIRDGEQLREWIRRDLDAGVDLLQRKYNWIRTHIFHGIEFGADAEPLELWNVDCAPYTQVTCGTPYSSHTSLGSYDVEGYSCNTYDYSGPEMVHALRFPIDATVTVEIFGLNVDLDLLLLAPADDACDSSTCVAASTNGGTAPELLTFDANANDTYYIVVDGFQGAVGPYIMNVICESFPPGFVPQYPADGVLLSIGKNGPDTLSLSWGESCDPSADYAVYRGLLGLWGSHEPEYCSTAGRPLASVPMHDADFYFLVVSHNHVYEGSHGENSMHDERVPEVASCTAAFNPGPCP